MQKFIAAMQGTVLCYKKDHVMYLGDFFFHFALSVVTAKGINFNDGNIFDLINYIHSQY